MQSLDVIWHETGAQVKHVGSRDVRGDSDGSETFVQAKLCKKNMSCFVLTGAVWEVGENLISTC